MPNSTQQIDQIIESVETASAAGSITADAAANIKLWLTDDRYAEFVPAMVEHIQAEKWQVLDDVFWTVIPFGTGGRRGRMYPFGCNAINKRTIGESAQGLAAHVVASKPAGPWSAAIAYDTRHRSREFAELCAGVLVANGFTVYFIDDYRSTPQLSFLIRQQNCDGGIMVTASHNPPSDNAVKVYWSTGAQIVPPHDRAIIEQVQNVNHIEVAEFAAAVESGAIKIVTAETDAALLAEHIAQSFPGPRELKVIYSPLHGVGEANVGPLLAAVGFSDVEIYEPHREKSGDFPNVPGHVSNPENKEVFTHIIERAQSIGADLILATDPDCDRMGAAVPLTVDSAGPWSTFNGNQLGVLLADYVLNRRQHAGGIDSADYVITTIVTSRMIRRIAESYGVNCFDDNLVGFKWICRLMDIKGPDQFVFGCEESHGYLVGQYCRDKDGAVACMLMAELAAEIKSQGISLFDHLDQLYLKHGYHAEDLITIKMEGSDGMARMQALMNKFRTDCPASVAGLPIVSMRDYQSQQRIFADGRTEPFAGPQDNLIVLETEAEGNYIAARPSGTEPKVKFYLFANVPADEITELAESKREMAARLAGYQTDLQLFTDSV